MSKVLVEAASKFLGEPKDVLSEAQFYVNKKNEQDLAHLTAQELQNLWKGTTSQKIKSLMMNGSQLVANSKDYFAWRYNVELADGSVESLDVIVNFKGQLWVELAGGTVG